VGLQIRKFAGEFEAVATWTAEPEQQLRDDEDYRAIDREHWLAWDGPNVVGAVHPWRAPDGRHRLYFDKCREDALAPLAAAIAGECFATVDATEAATLVELAQAGFARHRTGNAYEIPVTRVDAQVPAGIVIVTADQSELGPLMDLDCAIRAGIPGSDGWRPDPVWFRAETYDSPSFDPQTYCIALDGTDYVGLARVWKALPGHRYGRLGCVGVRRPYRRRRQSRVARPADEPRCACHGCLRRVAPTWLSTAARTPAESSQWTRQPTHGSMS
jgi:hypothetical protein